MADTTLNIFWEDGEWVNYKNGIKTVFREVKRVPVIQHHKHEPPLNEGVRNIFENKEPYNG